MKYGDELAVNAGDSLHIIMWKMLADNVKKSGDEVGWKIFYKMNETLLKTTEGQFYELSWINEQRIDITEEQYFEMIYRKSAIYTTICPVQLGAISAGVSDEEILKGLIKWAKPFGYAFQIWDDVMNLTEKSEVQGKETAGDILEGKRTLALIHSLKLSDVSERQAIVHIYSKKREDKTEEEKNYVLGVMKKYYSLEYSKDAAKKFASEAKQYFKEYASQLPDSTAKEVINAGIEFVVNRSH
jgi:geranylgeranyl diphosphate synthase type II